MNANLRQSRFLILIQVTPTHMRICTLASGSAGNCAVVHSPGGVLLIDAGIGPRVTSLRLRGTGISFPDISAICLTHLDRDHFRTSWVTTIARRGIPVFCNSRRVGDLLRIMLDSLREGHARLQAQLEALIRPFDEQFEPLPGIAARAIPLAHDQAGSHAFVLDGSTGERIGYATDLGHVPDALLDSFDNLDVLALESNYDPRMQRESGRPLFLQQRITGGSGHLSNGQAFEAVLTLFERSLRCGRRLPAHVLLLHRSRDCNCPDLVRRIFCRDPRIAPRLTLAEQFQRTNWMGRMERDPILGEQMAFEWAVR